MIFTPCPPAAAEGVLIQIISRLQFTQYAQVVGQIACSSESTRIIHSAYLALSG